MPIPSRPIATVSRTSTVMEAVQTMASAGVGCVLVVDGDRLDGIFSERDVMLRVVLERRDPSTAKVEDVMTSPVSSIPKRTTREKALQIMLDKHIRHLPIVDGGGRAQAMVSMRDLLQEKVKDLHQQLNSLESYLTADGIGG